MWKWSLVDLRHLRPEVVSVLHQCACTNVMLLDILEPNPRFASVLGWYFGRDYVVKTVSFSGSDCTTKDRKDRWIKPATHEQVFIDKF